MATKKVIDQFANIAAVLCQEAAAGTLVSAKFAFPFSIMDKMALLISRIEYWPAGVFQLNSASDYILFGLLTNATIVDPTNQADPILIDSCRIQRVDFGAAASGEDLTHPLVKDFSTLPGGGILVAPNPLYGFVVSNGAAGVTSSWVKLFYTYMELQTDEYWQLVESRRIIST